MNRLLKLALLLFSLTLWAQYPQVPLTGNIGSGGVFPLINSPSVVFATDANHTMTYPEISGSSGFILVTSSTSLSATRNLVAPLAKGFTWAIENATTGGHSIQIIGATGTGVTIANGYTLTVYCDGTNYVTLPSSSGGTVLGVTGMAPVASSGGTNPVISMAQANGSTNGYLASIDWTTFNGKQNALGFTPAHSGANSDITSLSGLTTPLPSTEGGSGTAGGTGYRYGNGVSPDTYNPTLPQPAIEHCWSIQPGVAAVSTMLGAVYYAPTGLTAVSSSLFVVRLTGPMTCSSAPVIQFMDLGVGAPWTIYGSATVLLSLTTGITPGVYSNLTGSFTTVAGHWYGIALGSSTACSVYPTFDISLYF